MSECVFPQLIGFPHVSLLRHVEATFKFHVSTQCSGAGTVHGVILAIALLHMCPGCMDEASI